eukprot:GHVS01048170.1.p1 GENE.GHVS01048170.1~~GHVS01048170.1.p1  ORF type:complete len:458 (-),score=64.78 GHVS01048170.1:108-1481(-)
MHPPVTRWWSCLLFLLWSCCLVYPSFLSSFPLPSPTTISFLPTTFQSPSIVCDGNSRRSRRASKYARFKHHVKKQPTTPIKPGLFPPPGTFPSKQPSRLQPPPQGPATLPSPPPRQFPYCPPPPVHPYAPPTPVRKKGPVLPCDILIPPFVPHPPASSPHTRPTVIPLPSGDKQPNTPPPPHPAVSPFAPTYPPPPLPEPLGVPDGDVPCLPYAPYMPDDLPHIRGAAVELYCRELERVNNNVLTEEETGTDVGVAAEPKTLSSGRRVEGERKMGIVTGGRIGATQLPDALWFGRPVVRTPCGSTQSKSVVRGSSHAVWSTRQEGVEYPTDRVRPIRLPSSISSQPDSPSVRLLPSMLPVRSPTMFHWLRMVRLVQCGGTASCLLGCCGSAEIKSGEDDLNYFTGGIFMRNKQKGFKDQHKGRYRVLEHRKHPTRMRYRTRRKPYKYVSQKHIVHDW